MRSRARINDPGTAFFVALGPFGCRGHSGSRQRCGCRRRWREVKAEINKGTEERRKGVMPTALRGRVGEFRAANFELVEGLRGHLPSLRSFGIRIPGLPHGLAWALHPRTEQSKAIEAEAS